jgi:hypothetical protein
MLANQLRFFISHCAFFAVLRVLSTPVASSVRVTVPSAFAMASREQKVSTLKNALRGAIFEVLEDLFRLGLHLRATLDPPDLLTKRPLWQLVLKLRDVRVGSVVALHNSVYGVFSNLLFGRFLRLFQHLQRQPQRKFRQRIPL